MNSSRLFSRATDSKNSAEIKLSSELSDVFTHQYEDDDGDHCHLRIQLPVGTTRNDDGPKVAMSGDRLVKRSESLVDEAACPLSSLLVR
jgi:hypothetical protein